MCLGGWLTMHTSGVSISGRAVFSHTWLETNNYLINVTQQLRLLSDPDRNILKMNLHYRAMRAWLCWSGKIYPIWAPFRSNHMISIFCDLHPCASRRGSHPREDKCALFLSVCRLSAVRRTFSFFVPFLPDHFSLFPPPANAVHRWLGSLRA